MTHRVELLFEGWKNEGIETSPGFGRVGLGWFGLVWVELGVVAFSCTGSGWIGLGWREIRAHSEESRRAIVFTDGQPIGPWTN